MIDIIQRHAYRVARNFAGLVFFFMTADFLAGPIYYLVSIHQYGFYWLAGWQIKMIFTSPITNFLEYPYSSYDCFTNLKKVSEDKFVFNHIEAKIPMMYGIEAIAI